MAEALKYKVPPPTLNSARDELGALLQTLYESGTLRALNGFFGSLSGIAGVTLEHAQTPGGQRLSSNLAVIATSLTKLDMGLAEKLTQGLVEGVERAASAARQRPPGFFRLLFRMHSREARVALHALVVVLESMGRELSEQAEKQDQEQAESALLPSERGSTPLREPYLAGG